MISRAGERKTWIYLFMATGSMLLLAITAFTIVSLYAVRTTAYRQTEENLREFSYAVAHFISAESHRSDRLELRALCDDLGAGPDFRITVIAADGSVLADSTADPATLENHANRPEVQAALTGQEKAVVRYSQTLKKELVYYAIPLGNSVIRLATTVTYIDTATKRMMTTLIIAALIILLVALAVSFAVSSRIIIPLRLLENAANAYSEGHLDIRYKTENFPKEFIKLSQTFSLMADKLREKITAMDEQNRQTEAILSGMNDALIVLGTDNAVKRVNGAAEKLFGITLKECVGTPLIQTARNTDIVDFALEKNGADAERTIEIRTPGRDEIRYLLVKSSRISQSGELLLVFNDITRLKTLERIRKDFVANVSHELKTPVTSIKGFIETLSDGAIDDKIAARRFLGIMEQQSSRLGAIIDDLLTISRLEQGEHFVIVRTMTKLDDLVGNVRNLCDDEAQKKNTALVFDYPETALCPINPGLIEQALTNLILNAVKYNPESSKVAVGIAIEPGKPGNPDNMICTVADNGIGIPRKHLERIFERFYRVDPGRSREQGGTGLGLSIVRHIALAHGGTVTVDSTEGIGSSFRMEIPLEPV